LKLAELNIHSRSRRFNLKNREARALRVLDRLAHNIDRIYRQSSRRTLHAQDRHRDRERPASTALRDALEANTEALLRDGQEATWIVLGPKNRVHVFNDEGQHVTSIVYPGETIRKRTHTGKWKNATPEAVENFREQMRRVAEAPGISITGESPPKASSNG
jgi:hypothetical protein